MADKSALDAHTNLMKRWSALKQERSTWMPHWYELSQFYLPRSGRYFVQDRNRGMRRHNNIYDSTGTRAVRVLAAGMMSGMMSPARPWFRLETPDPDLNKRSNVKIWLAAVTSLMLDVFAKSNTYRAAHSGFEELSVFGTAAKVVLPNFQNVIHHMSLTCGEYAIATDYLGNVNTLAREFEKPVGAVVGEFGYENCSLAVRNLFDRGTLDAWIPIVHLIEPRKDRDVRTGLAKDMPWTSNYVESGAPQDKFLREGGFDEFPALVSRWGVSGSDIYGNCPGQEALGDVKQLQQEQLRKAQAIDYKTKPPLQAPSSMKNAEVEMLPGGVTFYDGVQPGAGIRSAFEVNLDLQHLLADIQDVRERIKSSFFTDLFLSLGDPSETRMTATEVAERHEEKMLMLGPTVERLHNEELIPLIESTFKRMVAVGMLPPPPEELHGMQLNVNFVSMLAQAQRAVSTNSIDRFVGNLGQIATFSPGVIDKFDSDSWADIYSDVLGIDPNLITPADKVALIRKNRAEQQQAQQKAAQANVAADTAQKLGNAPVSADNALGALSQGAGQTLAKGSPSNQDPTRPFSGYT